jgi:hypothetical protein
MSSEPVTVLGLGAAFLGFANKIVEDEVDEDDEGLFWWLLEVAGC